MDTIGLDCIIRHYSPGPGRHWFDKGSMRFFGCRLPQQAYRNGDQAYFVTSEQPPHGPRAYTVREYDFPNRNIRTVGEMLAYDSRAAADRAARKLASAPEASSIESSVADMAEAASLAAAEATEESELCPVAASELVLWARNTGELYATYKRAVARLCREIARGDYAPETAADAFRSFVSMAAADYAKRFATLADASRLFSPETRREAAAALLAEFESEYRCNGQDGLNPVSPELRRELPPRGER